MRQVDIKEFEDYQVTDDGRVWSKKRNRWLKPSLTNKHYNHIILCKDGIKYGRNIYRLVAEAFIPNPNNKPCVDHINTVRTDDRVENLRWCTYEENNNNPITKQKMSVGSTGKKHSEETKKKMSEQHRGEKNWNFGKHMPDETKHKISQSNSGENHYFYGKHHTEEVIKKIMLAQGKKVHQYTLDGELVKVWNSTRECGRNGFNQGHIAECCRGERNKHKGFVWKYE